MLSRTKKNMLKATTLTLALTALVILGSDLARAETVPDFLNETESTVFPAIYQENEDSCFVQVGVTVLETEPGPAPVMDTAEYDSLAYGCSEDHNAITVLRGARMYASSAR